MTSMVPTAAAPIPIALEARRAPQTAHVDLAYPFWPTELHVGSETPPKPIPAILSALQAIPAGTPQYVRTRQRPDEIMQALARHGVAAGPRAMADGTWQTRLVRAA